MCKMKKSVLFTNVSAILRGIKTMSFSYMAFYCMVLNDILNWKNILL